MEPLPNLTLIKNFDYLIFINLGIMHYFFFKCFICFCIMKLYLKLVLDCILKYFKAFAQNYLIYPFYFFHLYPHFLIVYSNIYIFCQILQILLNFCLIFQIFLDRLAAFIRFLTLTLHHRLASIGQI